MGIELKQSLRISQDLVITPQLRQAIELLAMNRMELSQLVTKELMENPILEDGVEEGETVESAQAADPEGEQQRHEDAYQKPETPQEELIKGKDDFNWDAYIEEFNSSHSSPGPAMREVNEDLPSFESALTKTTTIEDHLMWQLSMSTMTETEMKLGELIFGNLNDDGYLVADLADIAKEAGIELEDAEEVLKMIQRFDPVGVASRNLQECLIAQAEMMHPRVPLVETILRSHMKELEKRDVPSIARALNLPLEKLNEATKIILDFEPKPGRSFHTNDTHYIMPDVYVYKVGPEYVIMLNEDGMPKLRISNYYKNILTDKKDAAAEGASATKNYVQDKLRSAMWLIRSIHRRQNTIYKVTESIVRRQMDFFEKGVQHLKPMILKDVANEIGMHESTISRVTTNKYVHTPVGIFELKYFFNAGIKSTEGIETLASKAVKDKIRQLISKEDSKHPLSDQKIVELLKKDQIDIARRTVAKYREMMHILPSSKRKAML